jgi:hypothetical protein
VTVFKGCADSKPIREAREISDFQLRGIETPAAFAMNRRVSIVLASRPAILEQAPPAPSCESVGCPSSFS